MMKKLIYIFLFGLVLSACSKSLVVENGITGDEELLTVTGTKRTNTAASSKSWNTFWGPAVQIGKGHARSWVNIGLDEQPMAIGVEMTDGCLDIHDQSEAGETEHHNEFVLALHKKAKERLPFDHIVINWNENGHPPPGIYTVPHFDFHFYKMSMADRMQIPPYAEAPTAFDLNPPPGFLPNAYIKGPGGEARMGAHWLNILSPEFQPGGSFTHTFIYGTYNGKVNFLEPMVTRATLKSGESFDTEIRQPQLFDPGNRYYPTRYKVWKDLHSGKHFVALDEMVWRP